MYQWGSNGIGLQYLEISVFAQMAIEGTVTQYIVLCLSCQRLLGLRVFIELAIYHLSMNLVRRFDLIDFV